MTDELRVNRVFKECQTLMDNMQITVRPDVTFRYYCFCCPKTIRHIRD